MEDTLTFPFPTQLANQSPDAYSATRKHTFKRVERILDSSDEDSPPLQ